MSKPSVTNCPKAFFHVSCTLWAVRPRVNSSFLFSSFSRFSRYSRYPRQASAIHFSPIMSILIQAVIAAGSHLFPSRTEKLSPLAPMVLHTRGRVGSRHFSSGSPEHSNVSRGFPLEKQAPTLPRVRGPSGRERLIVVDVPDEKIIFSKKTSDLSRCKPKIHDGYLRDCPCLV